MGSIIDGILDSIMLAFYDPAASMFLAAFGSSPFSSLKNWLKVLPGSKGASGTPAQFFTSDGVVHSVYEGLLIFGVLIMIIYMLMWVVEEFKKLSELTLQFLIKVFAQIAFAFILLFNGFNLVVGISGLGDAAMDYLDTAMGTSQVEDGELTPETREYLSGMAHEYHLVTNKNATTINNLIYSASSSAVKSALEKNSNDPSGINKAGMGSFLMACVELLIIKGATWVVMILAIGTAIGRLIQIVVFAAFSPLGIGNVFGEGANAPAFRYIKKVFAIAIQGAIIYFMVLLQPAISNIAFSTTGGIIVFLAANFSIVGAMKKADSYSKEIVL